MKRITVFITLAFCAFHAHATETIDFDSLSLNQATFTNHTSTSITIDLFAKVGGTCNAGETATFLTDNEFVINHKGKFVNNFKIINQNTQRAQFTFSPIAEQKRLTLNTNVPEIVSLRRTSVFLNYIMDATLLSYWYNDENQIYIHFYPADANIQTIKSEIETVTKSQKPVRSSYLLKTLLSANSLAGGISSTKINMPNGSVIIKNQAGEVVFSSSDSLNIDASGTLVLSVDGANINEIAENTKTTTTELATVTTELAAALDEKNTAIALKQAALAQAETLAADKQDLTDAVATKAAEVAEKTAERDIAVSAKTQAEIARDAAIAQAAILVAEKETVTTQLTTVITERDIAVSTKTQAEIARDAALAQTAFLTTQLDNALNQLLNYSQVININSINMLSNANISITSNIQDQNGDGISGVLITVTKNGASQTVYLTPPLAVDAKK